jgi:hypothetical protein
MLDGTDKMQIRSFINDSLEFYIKESIYYRSNNEKLLQEEKLVVWQSEKDNGKVYIP